jgi:hypothetical protein
LRFTTKKRSEFEQGHKIAKHPDSEHPDRNKGTQKFTGAKLIDIYDPKVHKEFRTDLTGLRYFQSVVC